MDSVTQGCNKIGVDMGVRGQGSSMFGCLAAPRSVTCASRQDERSDRRKMELYSGALPPT